MKIYQPHRDLLFTLFAIEQNGHRGPVLCSDALEMINKNRLSPYFGSNFRLGCSKMVKAGLLEQYRTKGLKLAYRLTDEGRVLAEIEYRDRTQAPE